MWQVTNGATENTNVWSKSYLALDTEDISEVSSSIYSQQIADVAQLSKVDMVEIAIVILPYT